MNTSDLSDKTASLLAREGAALSLAVALSDPRSSLTSAISANSLPTLAAAWEHVASFGGQGDTTISPQDIDAVLSWITSPHHIRDKAHQSVFGLLISRTCPPHETEYLPSNDPTHRAHALADIAGYYRAFGLQPDPKCPERADHAAFELQFLSFLFAKMRLAQECEEHLEICESALKSFFSNHLLWWMPAFARGLQGRVEAIMAEGGQVASGVEKYAAISRVLRGWLECEMALLEVEAPKRPVAVPQFPLFGEEDSCASCTQHAEEFQCGAGEGA
ncbi:molecular chaperone TorD family protein [Candidatus Sumerlaeota bacterium]|nr:molecular chaperone TorD family protein [Candidatus Sumerlaeota bacterium]